ncbi:MAG: ketopantoate reductase family protein [Nitrospiria bacterium]
MNEETEKPVKKILVAGAGAVGGYFGGLLYRAGTDVTFLVRSGTFESLSSAGLKIVSPAGDFSIHPPVVQAQDLARIGPVDLIILAVKCTDVAAALKDIAPLVEQETVILTLQNGVGTEDEILKTYDTQDCVLAGVAFITARLARPGVVEHARRGTISLGELSGKKSARARAVHQVFDRAGIDCRLTGNIRRAKWEKLCWNATFNPLSVILDHPISLILENAELLGIVREGIREVIAVAAAEGIDINSKIIESTIAVSHDLKDYYTSMYEDYRNGKATEIEYLNGDLVRRGERHGIPTPVNQVLHALVKGLEAKHRLKPTSSS